MRELDQDAREVCSIGKSHRQPPWQRLRTRFYPDFPVYTRRSKGQVLAARSVYRRRADNDGA